MGRSFFWEEEVSVVRGQLRVGIEGVGRLASAGRVGRGMGVGHPIGAGIHAWWASE